MCGRPAGRSALHPWRETEADKETIGSLETSNDLLPGLGSRRVDEAVAAECQATSADRKRLSRLREGADVRGRRYAVASGCSIIRSGKRTPHSRHWAALAVAELVSWF